VVGNRLWAAQRTEGFYSSADGTAWNLASAPAFLVAAGATPAPGQCASRSSYGFGAFQRSGAASPSLYVIGGVQGCRMASGANYTQYLKDVWTSP
jgi:hypothetical protein